MLPVDFSRRVVCIMGLPFDVVDMPEAVRRVRDAALRREPFLVSTANLNFAVTARGDEPFRQSVIHSQLCVADGMPIVWVSRLLGLPVRERVSGAGLFEALSRSADPPLNVFFFGGADGVAQSACEQVNRRAGGIRCVGFESPGFVSIDAMSDDERIARINAARPDFVIVSLGAKKGQEWIERNRARLDAPVISHLGAVINFAAGTVRRAPLWMQRTGFEWAWRIKEEPALWRRYRTDAFALAGMFATSVLPLWWQRLHRRGGRAAGVQATRDGDAVTIRLSGDCMQADSPRLQQAFADAVASDPQRVLLDLSQVDRLDAAALGALLLLQGHQRGRGRSLVITGVSGRLARQFRHHGADHLLSR